MAGYFFDHFFSAERQGFVRYSAILSTWEYNFCSIKLELKLLLLHKLGLFIVQSVRHDH